MEPTPGSRSGVCPIHTTQLPYMGGLGLPLRTAPFAETQTCYGSCPAVGLGCRVGSGRSRCPRSRSGPRLSVWPPSVALKRQRLPPDHGVEGGGGVDARLPTSSRVLTSSALAASLVLSTARQGGRDALWTVRKLRPLALCPQPAGRREVLPDSWWPVGRPGLSLTPESQWVTEGGVGIGIF